MSTELSFEHNREAFGEIVRRYQGMVSPVTFSMTGNLQQSEDLAQETSSRRGRISRNSAIRPNFRRGCAALPGICRGIGCVAPKTNGGRRNGFSAKNFAYPQKVHAMVLNLFTKRPSLSDCGTVFLL